jgi:Fe2+ or Zn2+ uptake regulation protein
MNDIERAIEKIQRQNKKVAFDYTNGKDVTVITLICEEAETIINALEKQIPKKAVEIKDKHNFKGEVIFKDGYCPICKNEMSSAYFYCNKCGKAIDWSD